MECNPLSKNMDFFFFVGSTYSYLSVMRIGTMAEKAGVTVRWRPFNVREIMLEMNNVPFADKPTKFEYMWRDIERRAGHFGLEWTSQPPYPIDPDLLANRIGAIAATEGWAAGFTTAAYRKWFHEGVRIGGAEELGEVLQSIGKDPESIIIRAEGYEGGEALEEATREARNLGIFGAPTFMVGKEMFWGDDRLEDALEWAIKQV